MTSDQQNKLKGIALRTTSAIAIIASALMSNAASAQTASTSGSAVETVQVTGTRIVRDGYDAPTPTTVIGAAEIEAEAPANIASFVNQVPSLADSVTPTTTIGVAGPGTGALNSLNLRGLGPNRTLVLLDGQRVGAATLTDQVDINQFPEQLIKRVDVVTGGASADWGSDAVAGVVNFVLDKDFTGLKANIQGGVTTYGDDANYKGSLVAGTGFDGDRGHILFSAEYAHNDGITGVPRPWSNINNQQLLYSNPNFTATNGLPQYLVEPNSGFATATPGGIITSGPLKGTYFGAGGTPAQYNYGSIVSGNFMTGGQSTNALANSGDLDYRMSRENFFFRTSYNLTDHVQIFGQASASNASSSDKGLYAFYFGSLNISASNPYIPASTASAISSYNAANPATPIASFSLGTFNQDQGSIPIITNRSNVRFVIGANGDFDALGSNWTWDTYGEETGTHINTATRLPVTANYNAAINVVRNPTTGAPQCASIATNPSCVPYNVFGTGVNSSDAVNYVLGTSYLKEQLLQYVAAANVHGTPFSDWAGPISVAAGFEHRDESGSGLSDPLDAAALATSTANKTAIVNPYFSGNYHPTFGDYHVDEGYFEAVVPLAKDLPFAKSLDFNGAVRETDYSISGAVTTWKLGLTWSPIDDITFRGTRSQDIRAPDLAELFQVSQASTFQAVVPANTTLNPTGTALNPSIFQVTSGSTALKPEVAETTGYGFVVTPHFIPGFQASVDYYAIHIANAITSLSAQQEITECNSGATAVCGQINLAAGKVNVVPLNLATQRSSGLDFEASYHFGLDSIVPVFGGDLTLRGLATHFLQNYINTGIPGVAPTDNVGQNSENGATGGVIPSIPHWRYKATVTWEDGPVVTNFTARGISDGVINTSYIQCTAGCPAATAANPTINNNYVPGAFYFDANMSYQLSNQFNVYLAVDNLLNTAPVSIAYGPSIGAAPVSENAALYDTLGRVFRLGVRFQQ